MNEQIRELLKQAVISVDNPFPGNPLNDELEKMYIPDCLAEKFAELIVEECLGLFRDCDSETLREEYANTRARRIISKHFGVEE